MRCILLLNSSVERAIVLPAMERDVYALTAGEWSPTLLPSLSMKIAMKPFSPILDLGITTEPPAPSTLSSTVAKSSPPLR